MGSKYVCLQDVEDYGLGNQKGIKKIQNHMKILKEFR